MVHTFPFQEKYIVYDNESGSLFAADRLVYGLILRRGGGTPDLSGYTAAELCEAEAEIDRLTADGVLYTAPPELRPIKSGGEIKALCLHICHDCNMRCGYCFAGGGSYSGERDYMSAETAKKAVDFLTEHSGNRKSLEIDFFGGEPLLNLSAVQETVAYARSREKACGKQFKFTLTTNALLLTDEINDFLNREADNVVLSLDGRRAVNDCVRKAVGGGGTYDTVAKRALAFKKSRGEKSYYARGTYTAKNLDFCEDVLHLSDLGFDQISVEPAVLPQSHPLAIRREHLPALKKEYRKLAAHYIERRRGEKSFNFFHFLLDLENGPCLKKRITGCGAGDEYLAVAPTGELYPCHRFVGLKEYRIGSVYGGAPDQAVRAPFIASSLLTKDSCKECFAKYFCGGGCAANNILYEGEIDKPYGISCELLKTRFECALGIYAAEKQSAAEYFPQEERNG